MSPFLFILSFITLIVGIQVVLTIIKNNSTKPLKDILNESQLFLLNLIEKTNPDTVVCNRWSEDLSIYSKEYIQVIDKSLGLEILVSTFCGRYAKTIELTAKKDGKTMRLGFDYLNPSDFAKSFQKETMFKELVKNKIQLLEQSLRDPKETQEEIELIKRSLRKTGS